MRIPRNGRGAFPKIGPDTLTCWRFDGVTAEELLTGRGLSAGPGGAAPTVSASSPILKALAFDGVDDYREGAQVAGEVDAWNGRWTTTVVFRWTANPTGTDRVFLFAGNAGDTGSAENSLLDLNGVLVGTPPRIRMGTFWETASQSNVGTVATTWRTRLGQWYWLALRKRDPVGGEAGPVVLDYLVNGALVESFTGLAESADGADAVWQFGGFVNTGGGSVFLHAPVDICAVHFEARVKTDEEIRDDFQRGILQCFPTRVHHKVEVEPPGGGLVDMSSVQGIDWVRSVRIEDDNRRALRGGSVEFLREHGRLSLALLRTDSKVNLTDPFNLLSFDPLIDFGRRILISYANMPHLLDPVAADLEPWLDGDMDEPNWGGSNPTITVRVRDLGGVLMDKYVRTLRDYPRANFGTGGCPADAAPFEGMLQEFIDDNFAPTFTLFARDDPDFCARLLDPQVPQGHALPTLRMWAAQVGMEVRYLWDPLTEAFRLTLFDVGRDRVDADTVLSRDDIVRVTRAMQKRANVRNEWFVVFPNRLDLDDFGNKLPGEVTASDAASIARFNLLTSEMREEQATVIDDPTIAQRMVDAALADTKDPAINIGIVLPAMPWLEPQDLIEVEGDGIHWTGAQRVAIQRVITTLKNRGAAETTIELRGKPGFHPRRWLEMEARAGLGRAPVKSADESTRTSTVGRRLAAWREFWDKSDAFAGGKYLDIKNPNLSSAIRGLTFPPDGWTPKGVAWDAGVEFETSVVKSGTRAVRFTSSIAEIESDVVAVEGGRLLGIQATWARDTGLTNTFLQARVDFFAGDRVTFIGGTGALNSPVGLAANVFQVFRVVGIDIPALARFVRIRAMPAVLGGPFEEVIIDSISGITITDEFLVLLDENQSGLVDNTWTTILFDDDSPLPAHDFGDNVDTITPTGVFTAPQDGRYDFSALVTAGKVVGAGGFVGSIQARLLKNVGTVLTIGSGGFIRTFTGGDPSISVAAAEVPLSVDGAFLEEGDTVEVQAKVDTEAGTGTRVVLAGDREVTSFEGKLIAAE